MWKGHTINEILKECCFTEYLDDIICVYKYISNHMKPLFF